MLCYGYCWFFLYQQNRFVFCLYFYSIDIAQIFFSIFLYFYKLLMLYFIIRFCIRQHHLMLLFLNMCNKTFLQYFFSHHTFFSFFVKLIVFICFRFIFLLKKRTIQFSFLFKLYFQEKRETNCQFVTYWWKALFEFSTFCWAFLELSLYVQT